VSTIEIAFSTANAGCAAHICHMQNVVEMPMPLWYADQYQQVNGLALVGDGLWTSRCAGIAKISGTSRTPSPTQIV